MVDEEIPVVTIVEELVLVAPIEVDTLVVVVVVLVMITTAVVTAVLLVA